MLTLQDLFDKNILAYSFVGLCGLGILVRFIIDMVYKRLLKESDNLGTTKSKPLKHMKMKFETCYKLKIGVNNVDTFVDKNILRYRFCGILLSTWENFCGQVLFLTLLLVPVLAVFGVIYQCGQDEILFTGSIGIAAGSIMILVDKSINLSIKKKVIGLNLRDYFENFLKVRLEQEAFHPEMLDQYRKEYFQAMDGNPAKADAVAAAKGEPKDELGRRREARQKKEEEKRIKAVQREAEQKKIEEARREEEKQRIEEKKQLAAKRREEELARLEEERLALEERRSELKKKEEEKRLANERKQREMEEKDRLLHSIERELKSQEVKTEINPVLNGAEEIAAEKERGKPDSTVKETTTHGAPGKKKTNGVSVQEDKLIEDVLKEFFA